MYALQFQFSSFYWPLVPPAWFQDLVLDLIVHFPARSSISSHVVFFFNALVVLMFWKKKISMLFLFSGFGHFIFKPLLGFKTRSCHSVSVCTLGQKKSSLFLFFSNNIRLHQSLLDRMEPTSKHTPQFSHI